MDAPDPLLTTRLSPTPSGYLHLGNALNFVYVWLMARSQDAKLILRIDDLDTIRIRAEYVEDIFRTLDWLGLDYDEGPSGPDELSKEYSQTLRVDRYRELISALQEDTFVCTCTRKQIREISDSNRYPGTCRSLALDPELVGEFCLRIRVPEETFMSWQDLKQGPQRISLNGIMHDFIVQRKDLVPAYQIASLADDIDMGVNILVRGEDLKDSTAAQLFLADKLGFTSFKDSRFLHHPLLRGPGGEKLSKSSGALSIRELRKASSKPSDILSQIGTMLGCPSDMRIESIHDLLLYLNQIDGLTALTGK